MKGGRLRAGVKICGVTRAEDAVHAVDRGAAWIGVNFWSGSPRRVSVDRAQEIRAAVAGRASLVGVFVAADPGEVERVDREVELDLLQFHGDESPEVVAPWGRRAIKVFRIEEDFDRAQLAGFPDVGAWLFDVRHPSYGGTGRSWNYELVRDLPTDRPVLVAGGIRPDNVGEVLDRSGASMIDVCSGVESQPGKKDHALLDRLFEEIADAKQVRLA